MKKPKTKKPRKRKQNKCKACGFPVSEESTYCGECVCELEYL